MMKEGVSLALRLAIGLAAAPLVGIALAAGRATNATPADARKSDPAAPLSPATDRVPSGEAAADGPDLRAIEQALQHLADATVPKRGRMGPTSKAKPPGTAKTARTGAAPGRKPGGKRAKGPLSADHTATRHL